MTASTREDGRPAADVPVLNIANVLTVLRILLVPVFVVMFFVAGAQEPWWRVGAFVVFAVAMLTDYVDGYLARRLGLVTDFGKIADPIADKAMTGMAFIGLAIIADFLPAWLWWTVTVVVLLREWGVTAARLSVAREVVMPAKQSGKVKTTMQVVALGGFVAPFGLLEGGLAGVGEALWWLSAVALAVAVVLTLTSGYEFARDVLRHRAGRPTTAERLGQD